MSVNQEYSAQDPVELYRQMQRIRVFEERVIGLFRAGEFSGFLHTAIGQEAIAVGVCSQLRGSDWITATHRSHGHLLAKGMPMRDLLAEIYGKTNGVCGGVAGHVHVADLSRNILGGNGVLGQNQPIACGLALGKKLQNADDVVVTFFGDGSANLGAIHESMNFAAVWSLPVVFLCERNEFSELSHFSSQFRIDSIATRAASYGFPGYTVDGSDILAVLDTASKAISYVREGRGPVLIEARVVRWHGHYEGDPQTYRDGGAEGGRTPDPLIVLNQQCQDILTETECAAIREDALREMEDAVEFARSGVYPTLEEIYPRDVLGRPA